MDTSNLTARQILEIKGAFLYFTVCVIMGSLSGTFQVLARLQIRNAIFTFVIFGFIIVTAFLIYRRKRNLRPTKLLEWMNGTIAILAMSITRYRYGSSMDWTYAAQAYHIAAFSACFIIMIQFLYNKNLYRFLAVLFFVNYAVFLAYAASRGVAFHMHSVIDGAIVHDGIQIHREIFFFIVLGIMTFMSYRNIPITEDYDRKNEKQRDQIQRRSDIQRELFEETRNRVDDLFTRLEMQNRTVNDFADRIQNQAATLEEMSASMEELLATAERISMQATDQIRENSRMDGIIGELRSAKEDSRRNLDSTLEDMGAAASRTSTGHEKIGTVISTIEEISRQSVRISETVAIIIDIADKINLLSLNASIEAARAGDYGRGFAVVADEIGKLAVQTTDSIKEIERVLTLSTKATSDGVEVIQSAAVIIREMIDNISGASEKITLLKTSMAAEETRIGSLIEQMKRNLDLAGSINTGASEQKQAISSTTLAIEQANESMAAMVRGVNDLASISKEIYTDAEKVLEKSVEYAE